ncbi:cell division cycle 7-related protein kinase isoform X2 [Copidosoma floridanum]|nr:cell division cycle 7-related protein kinase isoform X2 [Copidosoma floridanum]
MLKNIPVLDDLFTIHSKIGEGSFSTVFLGFRKNQNGRDRKKYAIKYLVPICHPSRIERELQCLKDIGGQDNVAGLELCLRSGGYVAFIMPFIGHNEFSEYVHKMETDELREYMRALLTALSRVHSFKIIHRDIKPSNFLYNRIKKKYLLVDFGLAQKYVPSQPSTQNPAKTPVPNNVPAAKKRKVDENKMDTTLKSTNIVSVEKCYCFGKPKVCSLCLIRPSQTAPRAGTPGYRPPEVLLKYPAQTPAIDIWASGIIMLCMLSETHPFFRAPDDTTALAEIVSIFGSTAMQHCAKRLGKKLMFGSDIPEINLATLCLKLQERNRAKQPPVERVYKSYPDEAYELLGRLLDINFKTRITAEEALLHPFLNP